MKKTTLKQALQKNFPNVKFSVRRSYGSYKIFAIVKFTPTAEATYDAVMKIAQPFEIEEFCFYKDIYEVKKNRREDLEQFSGVIIETNRY